MSIPVRHPTCLVAAVLGWVVFSGSPVQGQNAEGMLVPVPNPITSDAVTQIRGSVTPRLNPDHPQHVKTIIFDFNPVDGDGKPTPAATVKIGACLDLQSFILKEVNQVAGVRSVAFVRAATTAHTVLPVLACKEIVMSKSAALGQITDDNVPPLVPAPLGLSEVSIYNETLKVVGKVELDAVVRKMYDPNVKLRKSNLREPPQTPVFFDANDPASVKKVAGDPDRMPPVAGTQDGKAALYTNQYARDVGLCRATAETHAEVAELYGLPPLRPDPLGSRIPDPYRWVIDKDIDGARLESIKRVIQDVRNKGGNILILVIDGGGKDLITARKLADEILAAQTGDKPLKIVAFIPKQAPGAGTVVALACSEIVMTKPKPDAAGDAQEAVIGDFEDYLKGTRQGDREAALASIRDLAAKQGYSPVLIDGMFREEIEILRVRPHDDNRANQRRFMTREEFEKNKDEWREEGKVVKPKGKLLKLNATLAVEYGMARTTVEGTDVKAVTTAYGWPDAKSPDPGWLERLANFLANPVVTVLLVVIGFTGLILELKVPGLTVPGIIAALCFILVFWAHSKFSGQTFALALLLFLLGLVLVGVEIFVLPGFGACGIFGILCMLAGLGLVTLDKVPQTGNEWGLLGVRVSQYLFAMMGAFALAFFIARFLPKLPGGNRLVLNAPTETGSPASQLPGAGEAAELLGAIGTANTPLRPAGVVKFGDKFVDVVSDGDFIPAGTRVQVIQVEATRIVVKEV